MSMARNEMSRYTKIAAALATVMIWLWAIDHEMSRLYDRGPSEAERIEQRQEHDNRITALDYRVSVLRDIVASAPASAERERLLDQIDLFRRRAGVLWDLDESESRLRELEAQAQSMLERQEQEVR